MDTIPTKIQYDGTTTPVPTTSVHTANELNDRIVEMQGAVTDSAQSLDASDAGQLSKAMFANAVGASSMVAGGTANNIILTPRTGASGFRFATPIIKDYSLLDGAMFDFNALLTNTGDVKINIGQTNPGGLVGEQPLYIEDGITEVPAGFIITGRYFRVRYEENLDVDGAFVLVGGSVYVPAIDLGQESTKTPNGQITKTGVAIVSGKSTGSVVFGDVFPNSITRVFVTAEINSSDISFTGLCWSKPNPTVSGFDYVNSIDNTINLNWIAIGN